MGHIGVTWRTHVWAQWPWVVRSVNDWSSYENFSMTPKIHRKLYKMVGRSGRKKWKLCEVCLVQYTAEKLWIHWAIYKPNILSSRTTFVPHLGTCTHVDEGNSLHLFSATISCSIRKNCRVCCTKSCLISNVDHQGFRGVVRPNYLQDNL